MVENTLPGSGEVSQLSRLISAIDLFQLILLRQPCSKTIFTLLKNLHACNPT